MEVGGLRRGGVTADEAAQVKRAGALVRVRDNSISPPKS
jgi:hypothetical protein